jgi:cyclic pyranopterin phosphate synthase
MTTGTPNFSVILPGKCNAKCDFCFWKYEKSPNNWLYELEETIKSLPDKFRRVSISGGEPTLSPVLDDAIKIIKNSRNWDAVVLTTNGAKVVEKINSFIGVNHVNLSVHSADDKENKKIFKTKSIPDHGEIINICNALNSIGIDVNFNCVLRGQFKTKEDVLNYIKFAKLHGASSICFRQDQALVSTDKPKEMLWFKDIKVLNGWDCPVCKVWNQYIAGIKVSWKSAVPEPSKTIKDVYELVFNQNGKLTSDWEGKDIVKLSVKPTKTLNKNKVYVREEASCWGSWFKRCGTDVITPRKEQGPGLYSRCGSGLSKCW